MGTVRRWESNELARVIPLSKALCVQAEETVEQDTDFKGQPRSMGCQSGCRCNDRAKHRHQLRVAAASLQGAKKTPT